MPGHIGKWFIVALTALYPCHRLSAQTANLSLSSATSAPGGTVVLSLSLSASGTSPVGLQWTLTYPSGQISAITASAGSAATAAGKTIDCASASGSLTCLLTGPNTNTMAAGIVANVQLTLAATAGTTAITVTNPVGVDAGGDGLTVSAGTSGVVAVAAISSLTCSPGSLNPGAVGTCTVTLTQTAPTGGSTVTLASNNASLTVPASVTVASGATTATFSATAAASIASNQSVTVTATLGSSSLMATVGLVAPVLISGVSCNPVSLGQSAVSTCTVTINQTAPSGGSRVTLASNNTSLTVPASVTVAAGATTATFSATAAASIASNQTATVTATLGVSSQTATISLVAPVLISGVSCSPSSLGQSAVSTCTVTLTQTAPAGGSSVTLASGNASLTVPASVTVASGATTATFSATAAASIASNQSATVTATLGASSQTATIALLTGLQISGVVCNPTSLSQSAVATCTVTLTQSAPGGGSSVALGSNNTSLSVPASVTVAAGATTATFSATAAASIASNQNATVTATFGSTSQSATISLSAPVLISALACNPASLGHGAVSTCTVTLNQTAPAGGSAVTLASNSSSLTVPASATVSAGAATATFSATAAATIAGNQSATITATLGSSSRTATISLTVASTGGSGGGGSGGSGGSGGGQPSPTLTVTPSSLTFSAAPGNPPAGQTFSIASNTSGTTFNATVATSGGSWLSVSPSSGTTNSQGTLTVNVNPTGLGQGTYTGAVNVVASSGASASVSVTLNVQAQITVSPTSLSFTWQQGAAAPASQGVSVFSNPSGVTATAVSIQNDGENWLTLTGGGKTPTSVVASVSPNLAPGTYSAAIAISAAGANTVSVPVSYTVVSASANLSVSPLTETLTTVQGNSAASGQVTVLNTGGGTLQFSAQATADQGTWLKLTGSGSGSAAPSTPTSLGFTADPAGLIPGLYTGQIAVKVANSSAQAVIHVIMAVSQAPQSLTLSQSAIAFSTVAGGPVPPAQSFTVLSQGAGSLNWTAQAQTLSNSEAPSANWISVTPVNGSSVGGQTGTAVAVSVNPAGLPAGQYYGSVTVSAPHAVNNPQSVSVLLNVAAAGQSGTTVELSTGGVLLSGPAGSTALQQGQVSLFNPSNSTINYETSVITPNGIAWLSASPASGSILPGSTSISIAANLSALPPGVQTGTIDIAFDNGTVGVINVTVVATSGTFESSAARSAAHAEAAAPSSACTGGNPSYLVPVFSLPFSLSVLQAAVPQKVQLRVVDDCGNPLTAANGGLAQVTFDNGDSAVDLNDVGGGIWEGTWTPLNVAVPVSVRAVTSDYSAGLSSIAAGISVTVQSASSGAPAQLSGVINAANSEAMPQVVTPGSYVAIYGTGLASNGVPLAGSTPLPTSLNGTQILLGNQPLPLLYAGPGQVNAVIPQNLNPNTTYQLVVQRGSTSSTPTPLAVAEYQPGIYTLDLSGAGQGIVEIAGTTLLAAPESNGARPVQSGSEYLTIFATGLGPVIGANGEAAPADGVAAPLSTLYQTTVAVSATIGGVSVPVLFSGLTPSLVQLYQVNVQVPAGVPTGSAVPLVLTLTDPVTGQSVQSNTVTVAVQ